MTGHPLELVLLIAVVSAGVYALLAAVTARAGGDAARGVARLQQFAAEGREQAEGGGGRGLRAAVARAGAYLLPREGRRTQLEARLNAAGLYRPGSAQVFLGARLILTAVGLLLALGCVGFAGPVTTVRVAAAGVAGACLGWVGPGLWLDARQRAYQGALRRGLPDALDLLVLCLEGGGSLAAAIQRVTDDLELAHPLLAAEMGIVMREMQMGMSAGESIKRFGERCGLEEVRDLASVLLQSERFGAGMAKVLRLHSDASRVDRQQRAEESAQKAAVKILFPTLLCIFPAIFIVLLGPAAYQMAGLLSKAQ